MVILTPATGLFVTISSLFSLPGALVRALPFLKAFRKRNPDGRPRKDLKPEKF